MRRREGSSSFSFLGNLCWIRRCATTCVFLEVLHVRPNECDTSLDRQDHPLGACLLESMPLSNDPGGEKEICHQNDEQQKNGARENKHEFVVPQHQHRDPHPHGDVLLTALNGSHLHLHRKLDLLGVQVECTANGTLCHQNVLWGDARKPNSSSSCRQDLAHVIALRRAVAARGTLIMGVLLLLLLFFVLRLLLLFGGDASTWREGRCTARSTEVWVAYLIVAVLVRGKVQIKESLVIVVTVRGEAHVENAIQNNQTC
mmetsp:Transcript_32281/g.37255  ORF Transcript_32281/g.37255 Transcript_32281/m.37255 type:complete len:258 (-) Transcript_32281:1807-2580(-)